MLRNKLQADQITALKSGDKKRLDTLRYILSRIKNQEIEKKGELEDEEVVRVLRKTRRELQESIAQFEAGGRSDLSESVKEQIAVIDEYLPVEASDEELKKEVEKVIAKNQDLYASNPKAVIGICVRELKEKADSARIVAAFNSLQK